MSNFRKATWISKQIGYEHVDNIIDIILGNITRPADLVRDVKALSDQYDETLRRNNDTYRQD